MKKFFKYILLALTILASFNQNNIFASNIKDSLTKCMQTKKLSKKFVFFQDINSYKWKPIESITEENFACQKITFYIQDNRILSVLHDIVTPSGDWSIFTDYCFRDKDGSLAVLQSELNTFNAIPKGVTIKTRVDYDCSGNKVKIEKQMLDLSTQKPVKRSAMKLMPLSYHSGSILIKELGLSNMIKELSASLNELKQIATTLPDSYLLNTMSTGSEKEAMKKAIRLNEKGFNSKVYLNKQNNFYAVGIQIYSKVDADKIIKKLVMKKLAGEDSYLILLDKKFELIFTKLYFIDE